MIGLDQASVTTSVQFIQLLNDKLHRIEDRWFIDTALSFAKESPDHSITSINIACRIATAEVEL
ncbi:hypothetical protein [Roseiconus lacunae]|uniref:hypothetical protein n=1 Tax=Roseiconus lacunae TaxID=2605694 RepID=UPI0013586429|nr:hypothetical protein [Roseiconus lacunae]